MYKPSVKTVITSLLHNKHPQVHKTEESLGYKSEIHTIFIDLENSDSH